MTVSYGTAFLLWSATCLWCPLRSQDLNFNPFKKCGVPKSMRTAKTKADSLSTAKTCASSPSTISRIQRQWCMLREAYQQCGTSVQWLCISILSLAFGIPTWVLLQAYASGTRTVTNAPQSKEELSRLCGVLVTCVGKSSQRSEYVNALVSLWSCLSSQMLCVCIVLLSSPHQTAPFFLGDVSQKLH